MKLPIATPRLQLRAFRVADADDVLAYAADEQWSRYLDAVVPYPYVRDDALNYVEACMSARGRWPVAVAFQGRVVGAVDVRPDRTGYRAELGWAIGRPHWGQGLMTEAVGALVEHLFDHVGVERVYARSHLDNAASWRVMEKVGMRREAVLRQHGLDRYGVPYDEVWYAILREDRG